MVPCLIKFRTPHKQTILARNIWTRTDQHRQRYTSRIRATSRKKVCCPMGALMLRGPRTGPQRPCKFFLAANVGSHLPSFSTRLLSFFFKFASNRLSMDKTWFSVLLIRESFKLSQYKYHPAFSQKFLLLKLVPLAPQTDQTEIIAPGEAWGRRKSKLSRQKPFGVSLWDNEPTQQSLASSWKRVLRG